MGIDITVIKGYGILIPLKGNEEVFDQLDDQLDFYGSCPDYDFGVSGSYYMTGDAKDDFIWFATNRLLQHEDAKHSDGFMWTFDEEELTEDEVKILESIAKIYFDLPEPVEPQNFVTLMVS